MTEPFDPLRARSKRPLPIWIDAFLRDTMHLKADEIGAYHLILYAMWTRPKCDFPDDDRRLAQVARVSARLWKTRIGPTLRALFKRENGMLYSKRLRHEAAYVEQHVTNQSERRRNTSAGTVNKKNGRKAEPEDTPILHGHRGNASSKPWKLLGLGASADATAGLPRITPRPAPTQEPNNLKVEEEDARAREAAAPTSSVQFSDPILPKLIKICGYELTQAPPYWRPPGAVEHIQNWRSQYSLSDEQILDVVKAEVALHDDMPEGPKAFDGAMRRYSRRSKPNAWQAESPRRGPQSNDLLAQMRAERGIE